MLKDKLICSYKADFKYFDCEKGDWVVEDVKSVITAKLPVYRIKKKMMNIFYDIDVKEVL